MADGNGSILPYLRFHLLGTLGSVVLLLGLLTYDGPDILPIPLPPKEYGIPLVVVGFVLILRSGWLFYRHRIARFRAQQERKP